MSVLDQRYVLILPDLLLSGVHSCLVHAFVLNAEPPDNRFYSTPVGS